MGIKMYLVIYWVIAVAAAFSYFLYPLILLVFSIIHCRKHTSAGPFTQDHLPKMSLIVTAYNEASRIRKKIENTLELDYPSDKLQIVVASDCSDDGTDDIVKEYLDKGVALVRAQERLGKENAQLAAIAAAEGEILVFSDTATQLPQDALQKLAPYFADASVGAISSEDRFLSKDGVLAGEGAYVKYEMWLRRQESRLAGLVGLSGSFFAARSGVCKDWDIHSPSDFNTALNAVKSGMKAVSAPDVVGYYEDLKDSSREYQRKIRTVIRGMTGLSRHREVLNPKRFGFFAFQVFSHKLMRWLTPWVLVIFFLISTAAAGWGGIYLVIFLAQLSFYGLALFAQFLPRLRTNKLAKIAYFFVQVNVAIMEASIKFLAGERMTTWKPSVR